MAGLQSYANCIASGCLSEAFSCLGSGSGGAGGSAKTCADLSTCCDTLTDADDKMSCAGVAALKIDLACGLAYASFCG